MKGFSKTRTPNMWRNDASGRFYAVSRTPAKPYPVLKSLKTDKESVAKLRLESAIAKIRARSNSLSKNNLKLAECVESYLQGKRDEGLKALSYEYCERSVKMIRDNFKGFDAYLVEAFTAHECKVLTDRLKGKYSKRRFNGALWTLRGILAVAVRAKVIKDNPAMDVKPFRLEQNARELPSNEKFYNLIVQLRRNKRLKNTLAFVRILALTGHRPESVRRLRREHVDLEKRVVKWPPIKHKSDFNRIPMSDELYEVLAALMKDHKGDGPLVPVKNPRKALQTASKLAGITPPVTPGALRHFWSSRAMESDIPVHVIAAMRGDRDGGKTLLKTYAHLRDAHVREMVARLPGTGQPGPGVQRPAVPACQPRRSGRVTAVR